MPKTAPKIVHIDIDSLVYSHGLMADNKRYVIQGAEFQYKKEILKFCSDHSLSPDDIEITKSPSALMVPMNSLDNDINKIRKAAGGDDAVAVLHLTGGNQFRVSKATIKPYKGNRDSEKPRWFHELREHLVQRHGATIHEYIEADDAVVMVQHADPEGVVIAHIDKDIDQSQGWHYNWKHKELYYINAHEADLNFFHQMIKGDNVDNIAGIFFLTGKKCPAKVRDRLDACVGPENMFLEVIKIYLEAIAYKKADISLETIYNQLLETGALLYMLRSDDDFYKHPYSLAELEDILDV